MAKVLYKIHSISPVAIVLKFYIFPSGSNLATKSNIVGTASSNLVDNIHIFYNRRYSCYNFSSCPMGAYFLTKFKKSYNQKPLRSYKFFPAARCVC